MNPAPFPVPGAFPFPAPLKGGAGKTGKPGIPEKPENGNFGKVAWVPESEQPRRPYRFRLCADQGGGVYLTQTDSFLPAIFDPGGYTQSTFYRGSARNRCPRLFFVTPFPG